MAEKDNFLLEWYKRLQFKNNPFEDEILRPVDEYMAGNVEEKKKLNLFVLEKQRFGTLQGEKGSGKTMLLRWLQEQLVPHEKRYTTWYLKADDLKTEHDLIQTLTSPLLSRIEKITHAQNKLTLEQLGPYLDKKIHPKTLFLLVDNLHPLPPRYLSLFKHLYGGNVQLLLAGTKNDLAEAGQIGQKDLLKITLKGLSLEEARRFIQKRIEHAGGLGLHPFTTPHFQELYPKSHGNPSALLKLCREKALQLSLDKNYLQQALQTLTDLRSTQKPKGLFHIRFMSDEDYAREQMLRENPPADVNLPALEPVAEEPSLEKNEEPRKEPERIETPKPAEETLHTLKNLTGNVELHEEKIVPKEMEKTEVPYEFQETSPPPEDDVINTTNVVSSPEYQVRVTEHSKPDVVITEDPIKKPTEHKKKTTEKTKEAEETEDFINQLAKEFDKI